MHLLMLHFYNNLLNYVFKKEIVYTLSRHLRSFRKQLLTWPSNYQYCKHSSFICHRHTHDRLEETTQGLSSSYLKKFRVDLNTSREILTAAGQDPGPSLENTNSRQIQIAKTRTTVMWMFLSWRKKSHTGYMLSVKFKIHRKPIRSSFLKPVVFKLF